MTSAPKKPRAPLSDVVVTALARLVDDAQCETREPSHSDLDFVFQRAGIAAGDPKIQGQVVGKAKRVRAALSWAIEHSYESGEIAAAALVAQVQGFGGFRQSSTNFVGAEAIQNLSDAFRSLGFELSETGDLRPLILENLSADLTAALQAYVTRAKRGVLDAALIVGTSKDLIEATAAHILIERFGAYSQQSNFPTLLGQAYAALSLPTPQDRVVPGEAPQRKVARALFEIACAMNGLRNKNGIGHGRPWLPSVTDAEARIAVEAMGVVAEFLLLAHSTQA